MNTAQRTSILAALMEAILLTSTTAPDSEIAYRTPPSANELERAIASVPGLGRSILDFGM